ncbi:LysM peptidoglycan-binding domain-containing protein [Sulfitobacter guttiformis]|uniref:LysM domain-containing protein n=1 Tax=Sulfitobacter guttiformis TaxID=74349 RepID=A0A420DT47_9RHOB|nr:LysM peptidoglycan-binding domain-containing protein [Sulfitobacter guttiformis]KIN74771.1 LysM domain protein [Sulfitobacter guttiformis KCTC 32187]RKE97343.1 LysM domain-containing protein [Sulfitobacter guttiformis]
MKTRKPKISFNATPNVPAPDAQDYAAAATQTYSAAGDTWPAPAYPSASSTSGLGAYGQPPHSEKGFFVRNRRLGGMAAMVGLTLVLGFGAVFWTPFGDEEAGRQMAESTAFEASADADDTATRAIAVDLTNVSAAVAQPSEARGAASGLTAAVLASLTANGTTSAQQSGSTREPGNDALEVLSRNKIRLLHEAVLAGQYDIETYQQNGVTRVRLRAGDTSLANPYATVSLKKTMRAGEAEFANSLMTPEGDIDVDTMMFNLVQTSLYAEQTARATQAANGMSRKIFAASSARTDTLNNRRFYSVQAGDSLAYISLQFFGDPAAYVRILAANQSTLQSPDMIQIGQRLLIPG